MSGFLDQSVACLDTAGALVLDIAEAGGYELVTLTPVGRRRRREVATSPFVDGDHEVRSSLASGVYAVTVRVLGVTWPVVEGRRQTLVAAFEQDDWILRVSTAGVVEQWRANAADLEDLFNKYEAMASPPRRTLTFQVPVQPHPTVTGAA